MNLRYSLLKYIYNLFVQRNGHGLIYYPPMFEFDTDFELSREYVLENQVMVGRDLMFSIRDMLHFPKGVTWYALNE
jgi:alpha-glucosidase (family GH31 glycosyl hydrolase)